MNENDKDNKIPIMSDKIRNELLFEEIDLGGV